MQDVAGRDLDRAFRVLADPTRRGILRRLSEVGSDLTVSELARPYDMSMAAVSKHLKSLEGAGFVERSVEGREHRFRLRPEGLARPHDWLSFYERFWTERLDALEALLAQPPTPPTGNKRGRKKAT
jgi:DNA-binding transcriptional ArsR family regulator